MNILILKTTTCTCIFENNIDEEKKTFQKRNIESFQSDLSKKGALDSQPQVIKFTSCLPMAGGSLRLPRLLPPLKLVAMI
jgi:hypothetical protein